MFSRKTVVYLARVVIVFLFMLPLLRFAIPIDDTDDVVPNGLTVSPEPSLSTTDGAPRPPVPPPPPLVVAVPIQNIDSCEAISHSLSAQRAIRVCYAPATCTGTVRIDAVRPEALSHPLSPDATMDRFLKSRYGADSWRLLLEGTERTVLHAYVVGGVVTSYEAPFAMHHVGEYSITIKWEYTDGWGIDETRHRPLRSVNKQVVHKGQVVRRCASPVRVSLKGVTTQEELPSQGRWVRRQGGTEYAMFEATGGGGKHRVLRGADHTWHGHPPLRYSWIAFHQPRLMECVRRAGWEKFLITGDSQSRSVFHAVKNRLSGGDKLLGETTSEGVHEARGERTKFAETQFGGMKLTYVWDNYLEKLGNSLDSADVIVVGFGAHPASWGQWSYSKFNASVWGMARMICDRLRRNASKRIVWYGAPAWPKMKPDDNFRVTNSRLHLFNAMADDAMKTSCGVPVLNFFGISWPQLKLSRDGAHYDGTVVMATFADMLFTLLC